MTTFFTVHNKEIEKFQNKKRQKKNTPRDTKKSMIFPVIEKNSGFHETPSYRLNPTRDKKKEKKEIKGIADKEIVEESSSAARTRAVHAVPKGDKNARRSNLKKVAQTSRGLTLLGSRANEQGGIFLRRV